MATETLEEKKLETEAPAEDGGGVGDSGKAVSRESDEAEEKDEAKEKENGVESEEEETGQKGSSGINKSVDNEPVTPLSDRPTRTRKKVERYSLPTPSRSSGSKSVSIVKGRGTILRDIPNVAYKLSKRKPDDNLLLLHTILYGKKAKPQMLKKNIGQFSGFVWSEKEEEKQRTRVKEKLERCIKEKLIDFCDVLDIPINKSNVKKEELSVKVLEFLEYPKATRDVLLADRENKPKKRKVTPKENSGEASEVTTKRKRQPKTSGEKRNQPSETEETKEERDDASEGTNDSHEEDEAPLKEESDDIDTQTEDEKDEAEGKQSSDKKSSQKKTVKGSSGTKREDKAASTNQMTKSTSSSTKKQKVENEGQKDQNDSSEGKGKKRSSKSLAKDLGKEKSGRKGGAEPTTKEMFAVVARILKEVDFDTATLSDILKKLGGHFGVDLMHRKAEVKDIITEAMKEMTDDDDDDEEDEENTEAGSDIEKEDEERND
ncbi:PREDICTED: protein DEK-like [Tarenaya hassleriana]|uniref:protein DEK-like n=1 Tax=Tarenaya hassleriana TaxID=28532 RepID=UPI00053C0ACA|nr:PREDICTED: protein DEK-like [Tarenaya hassleriana]